MSGVADFLGFGKSSGEKAVKNFRPSGFSTGGLNGSFTQRLNRRGRPMKGAFDFSLNRSGDLQANLDGVSGAFADRSLAFRGLADRVAPGFGELTRTRVDAIRRAGERTVGSLRDRFRQRRVLGSSFAERDVAATEAEFAAMEEQAAAEAKVQELAMSSQFIGEAYNSAIDSFVTLLDQQNFESQLAASIATGTSQLMQRNNETRAELSTARRAGNAKMIGNVLGMLL